MEVAADLLKEAAFMRRDHKSNAGCDRISPKQAAKGNGKFAERFISSNKANYILLEVKKLRNKRTMPST